MICIRRAANPFRHGRHALCRCGGVSGVSVNWRSRVEDANDGVRKRVSEVG